MIGFVKRWFGTEEVAFRPGGTLVRYPTGMENPNSNAAEIEAEAVERGDTDQHIDNFSLLPPSEVSCWIIIQTGLRQCQLATKTLTRLMSGCLRAGSCVRAAVLLVLS